MTAGSPAREKLSGHPPTRRSCGSSQLYNPPLHRVDRPGTLRFAPPPADDTPTGGRVMVRANSRRVELPALLALFMALGGCGGGEETSSSAVVVEGDFA